jgi:predicted dehydrogenase
MERISVALVGAGYWGEKLLGRFAGAPGCAVRIVCDPNAGRLADVEKNFPGVLTTDSYEHVLEDPAVGAVALATPVATHFSLARAGLEAGKHLWVEKPLAMSLREGRTLVEVAAARRRVLFVDHTFLYDPLVVRARRLIRAGALGTIYHVYFQRVNLGRIKRDSNVWWNSGPHDLSLLLHLVDSTPVRIAVHGYAYLSPETPDLNVAVIEMSDGVSAVVYDSWLSPENSAKVVAVGSERMLVYEGKFAKRELRLIAYEVERTAMAAAPTHGAVPSRIVAEETIRDETGGEPLALAVEDFLGSIREGRAPLSDGDFSLKVLALLEAGERSHRSGGQAVPIEEALGSSRPEPS